MARGSIRSPSQDLQNDPGAVLYSFIQGEQTSQEVVLDFISDAVGYIFEVVIMEANNIAGLTEAPTTVKVGGQNNTLATRVRNDRGHWASAVSYFHDDLVSHLGVVYRLEYGSSDAYVNAATPAEDSHWVVSARNVVIIQFDKAISLNWTAKPTVEAPVYGFIEMSVKEGFGTFPQIWKPLRGVVSYGFSPTELV